MSFESKYCEIKDYPFQKMSIERRSFRFRIGNRHHCTSLCVKLINILQFDAVLDEFPDISITTDTLAESAGKASGAICS